MMFYFKFIVLFEIIQIVVQFRLVTGDVNDSNQALNSFTFIKEFLKLEGMKKSKKLAFRNKMDLFGSNQELDELCFILPRIHPFCPYLPPPPVKATSGVC